MTITSPSTLIFARSPVLYSLYDALYTEDGFVYELDVFLWTGAIGDKPVSANYSLEKKPAINGTAIFNISSIIQELFTQYEYDYLTETDDTNSIWYWVGIDYGYTYTGSGGGDSSTSLDSLPCVNGFNYYLDGINYLPTSHLGSSTDSYFMTDRPLTMDIPSDTSMYFFVYNDTGEDVKKIIVDINDGDDTEEFTNADYDSKIIAIGIGTTEVDAYTSETVEEYTISGTDIADATLTQTYSFTIVEPCKYGFRNLQFLNRYGVWDNLLVYGTEFETIDIDRKEIMTSPISNDTTTVMTLNTRQGQFNMVNISGQEKMTVNTGWLDEDWNVVIKQMLLSPYLYDADTLQPFTILTSSVKYKTDLNDKLINYTFELKYSNTAINTVF